MVQQRELRRIETWREFVVRWERAETEAEALGLLHTGAKIGWKEDKWGFSPPGRGEASEEMLACATPKVDFYLEVAQRQDMLGATATQLLVRHLLREETVIAWYAPTGPRYVRLLEFLGTVRDCIRKAPYPKMVSEFLWQSFNRWNVLQHPDDDKRSYDHYAPLPQEYREALKPLCRALLEWGELSRVLVRQIGHPPVPWHLIRETMAAEIREYLVRSLKRPGWSDDILTWSVMTAIYHTRAMPDLYEEDNRNELWHRAGLALLALMYAPAET